MEGNSRDVVFPIQSLPIERLDILKRVAEAKFACPQFVLRKRIEHEGVI